MIAFSLALLLATQNTPAPLPNVTGADSPSALRGGSVRVRGSGFQSAKTITATIDGRGTVRVSERSAEAFVVVFPSKPEEIGLGLHVLRVTFELEDGRTLSSVVRASSDREAFEVVADGYVAPKLAGAHPHVAYPTPDDGGSKSRTFQVSLHGEGFSTTASDNVIELESRGPLQLCWVVAGNDCKGTDAQAKLVSTGRIDLMQLPFATFAGLDKVRVRVGAQVSEWMPIVFSHVDDGAPLKGALLTILALVVVVVVSLWSVGGETIAGKRRSLLTAIFVDDETNSYSLSKLQFYVWTAAALFGYAYLTLCRSFVQGELGFADVPDGFPAILFVSGTTTIMAIGISSSRGPKGAGEVHPGFADFFTTGGVIAPERLQFFLWTLVGAATFCVLVMRHDPGTISTLPSVPTNFLLLMGVSSAGYLGGKFSRKPGPVIEEIVPRMGSLVLEIRGRNLSVDASFLIDATPALVCSEPSTCAGIASRPKVLVEDSEPGFAKTLRLEIATPPEAWISSSKPHFLTIQNPDGQKAVGSYTVPAG